MVTFQSLRRRRKLQQAPAWLAVGALVRAGLSEALLPWTLDCVAFRRSTQGATTDSFNAHLCSTQVGMKTRRRWKLNRHVVVVVVVVMVDVRLSSQPCRQARHPTPPSNHLLFW